jgi:hypothetical protein
MKKLLPLALMICVSYSLDAQILRKADLSNMPQQLRKHTRSVGCSADTLLYSYLKEVFDPSVDAYNMELMTGNGSAWSQGFELTGNCTVEGVLFWGQVWDRSNPSQTITAKAYLYSTNAAHQPISKLDSATVTVTTNQALYTATFATPVNITSNFAVVIQNTSSTDTLCIMTNNASTSTYGEALAWRKTGAGWQSAQLYAGQDIEPIIAPIVQYTIAADHSIAPASTVNLGTMISLTNMTTPTGMIENRMFNFNAFASTWGTGISDSSYVWDMGDGSANTWSGNTSYTYANPGTYNVIQVCMTGFFKMCMDSKASVVTVNSITGVEENKNSELSIYPSPTSGPVTVNRSSNGTAAFEVFNIAGELVYSKQITSSQEKVDLGFLTPAQYTIRITEDDHAEVRSLIISK